MLLFSAVLTTAFEGASKLAAQAPDSSRDGLQKHIVGGREAARNAWPWLAALIDKEFEEQFCGASLIHPSWVLTATHCLTDVSPDGIEVVFNIHNLSQDLGTVARRIDVAEIFLHPAYETGLSDEIDGDIALIRLATPILDIPTIPLTDSDQTNLPGTLATVAGWGVVDDLESPSNVVREVSFPIVSLATAQATGAYDGTLLEDMLAAGLAEGGKDSCQGDSGGPLMVPSDEPPGWTQVGIVSFGPDKPCGAADAFGIYSRVSYYFEDVMTTIHPGYSRWTLEQDVEGFRQDSDGDGMTTFQEYALGTNPRLPDRSIPLSIIRENDALVARFQHRSADDVRVTPEMSTDLLRWQAIDADQLTNQPLPTAPGEMIESRFQLSSGSVNALDARFFRLRIESPDTLPLPRYTNGPIRYHGNLPTFAGETTREFILGGAPVDTEVEMQVVATGAGIEPRLELINHETGEVIRQVESEADQKEIRLQFTPQANTLYRARISSPGSDRGGPFKFNFPALDEPSPATELVIAPGETIEGVLDEDDAVDEENFWDDYSLIDFTPGQTIRIEVRSNINEGGFFPLVLVFDSDSDEFVAESPFQEVTTARTSFQASEGRNYVISVTNLSAGQKGTYTLTVSGQ